MVRLNFRKILVTVIFTLLIWVWADLAQDEEFAFSNAKLSVTKSVNPALWVTFGGQPNIIVDKVVLKGPARRIADIRQRINDGRFVREFYFDPEHEKMTTSGEHLLNVAGFLNDTDKIVQLGLTVVSADPNTVTVNVVDLQKKTVPVKCYDDSQNLLKSANIEPAQVEAFVPPEREGSALEAKVVLNKREMEQARLAAIEQTPYVELSAGQIREAANIVRITLPAQQPRLQEYLITNVRLGFLFSANLQGKYRIELVNPETVMGTVAVRATPEAKRAYDNTRYHAILEIDDGDRDSAQTDAEIRRDVVYNFPPEFVRGDEITLNQSPVQARFKLVPLTPELQPATPQPAPTATPK